MRVSLYDRRQTTELSRRWSEISGATSVRFRDAEAIEEWRCRAGDRVLVLASLGSTAGEVELDAPPPVPEQVLDEIGVAQGWLIAPDFAWAVHADHDGFLPVELLVRDSETHAEVGGTPAGLELTSSSNRHSSDAKLRRSEKHCPVCLAPLEKNATRTRRVRECRSCGAHPQREKSCRRCSGTAGSVWESRTAAACRTCGLHGTKPDVIAAR
jgi:hypothetical protein